MNKSIDDLRKALDTIRQDLYPDIPQALIDEIINIQAGAEDASVKTRKVVELIERYAADKEGQNA